MNRRRASRGWSAPILGLILAGVAPALVFPTAARAEGCEAHYLTRPSELRRLSASLMPMLATLDEDDRPTDVSPPSPAVPLPCSGPSCHGMPGQPAAPAGPVSAGAPGDRWLVAITLLPSPSPDPSPLARSEPRVRPIDGGPSLFRPPRPNSGV